MQSPSLNDAEKFLEALFGDKPDSLNVLIWTLPGRESAWFTSISSAARYGTTEAEGEVYVGVGLSPQDFGRTARCKAEDVAAIGGLWADVDVADETRKKANLPRSEDEALAILSDLPLKPTALVHSGGGFQAWWMFKELWTFEKEGERERAAQLARRFNETLRNVARRRGANVDSTHDLARVLRLPGTVNNKIAGTPRPVRLVELDTARRFDPSEFDALLFAEDPGPRAAVGASEVRNLAEQIGHRIRLSSAAEPPFQKFFALQENDDKARALWEGRVRKLSASELDLALANICVQAQWEDQEIANVLIAMRRKHGDDLKLRNDYYGITIAKARGAFQEERDVEQAYEAVEQTLRGETPDIPPLEAVNRILGTEIGNIVLYDQDPPSYLISLKDEKKRPKVFISRHIASYAAFEVRYFELANVWPELKRGDSWKSIRRLIADHISRPEHQVDMGPEALEGGSVKEWLDSYLRLNRPADGLPKGAEVSDLPWMDDEHVYIRANHFRVHVERREFVRLESRSVPRLLRTAGLEPLVKKLGITSRRYWCVPGGAKALKPRGEEVRQ